MDAGNSYLFIAAHADERIIGRFGFGSTATHAPSLALRLGPSCISAGTFESAIPFEGIRWTHLAATVDTVSGEVVLYTDGAAVFRTTTSDLAPPLCDDGYPLFIGAIPRGSRFLGWSGWIDELRIWSVVRTQEEICRDSGGEPLGSGTCRR